MKIKLIKIGNSMGIRLPKTTLKECGFEEEVEMDVRQKRIILSPISDPRADWVPFIKKENFVNADNQGEWQW